MFEKERIGEIIRQLSQLRYPMQEKLTGWRMQKRPGESRPDPGEKTGDWQPVPDSGIWGGHFEYYAFRAAVTIPQNFDGKHVEFSLLTGREGQWDATNPQFTVYIDGVLRQGFDVNHHEITLSDCAKGGDAYELYLSAFTGTQNFHLTFDAQLRVVDDPVEQLYYDLLVPWQTLCLLEKGDPACLELTDVLTKAINLLDLRKPGSESYYKSVRSAAEFLKQALYSKERDSEATVRCIGHTHIDVAWLWTLAVTEDKSVRSFATVLELMKKYPEYLFMSSQPQLYQYVKKNAPELYGQIKARVEEGRWEPEGGMFLEADCNLASGEALVRQFLYGKRFFKQEFGVDNRILWLPDVFGYSAALPQIMKKCGIRYFMTTKISWSECNQMPYDSFYWKGIDGTKILTHFIPTRDYRKNDDTQVGWPHFNTTYTGELQPRHMKGAWQRYQQKKLNREVLCSFGYGDGGGGPTAWMLESQRRMSWGIPGCPKTKLSTAKGFFEQLDRDLTGKKVPVWSGELYLEFHRGTYTSMARNKKWNRRGEFALTDLESEALAARQLWGAEYPDLQEYWEILLRNQFHDILPGSSIFEVYEDSREEYRKLFAFTSDAEDHLLGGIADRVGKTIVWNPNGQTLSGLVELSDDEGRKHVQKTADGRYLAWAENIPAKGYAGLADAAPETGSVAISAQRVETPFAEITFNEQGHITSWFDKGANRQLLQEGQLGNVLMTYEDKPFQYDNWNLQDYYREKAWPVDELVSAQVTENGPYRYALRMQWRYQDSEITETLYFYGHSPRVDVYFAADWKEDQVLLKALFPVEINTTEATYEIQYGNVKRSTAVNTSWDQARFEVCHHKWMDVSEGGFGVSFLNDCKYGVSVKENVVGLSLLKCGRDPNPAADREYHEAVYSIYPHRGSWQEAGTVQQAYLLNNPLRAYTGRGEKAQLPERYSLVSHDHRNIMVESVKKAEDSAGTVIRLYEFENARTDARLTLPEKAKKIWLCNMLEEKETLLAENAAEFTLTVEPFGIVTILAEH